MDGELTFSMNSYKELCSLSKPGGVSLPVATLLDAAALCSQHISTLHHVLQDALNKLDDEVVRSRIARQEVLRRIAQTTVSDIDSNMEVEGRNATGVQGVDRNDPILQWKNLHQAAPLREA